MSDAVIHVELVSAARRVWSGEATMVIARTTDGDIGILPNHAPTLCLLVPGVVDIQTTEGETRVAMVDGGFLSVARNQVSVLSEHVEMSHEINLEKARHDLERARSSGEVSDDATARLAFHQARIRAAERAS